MPECPSYTAVNRISDVDVIGDVDVNNTNMNQNKRTGKEESAGSSGNYLNDVFHRLPGALFLGQPPPQVRDGGGGEGGGAI